MLISAQIHSKRVKIGTTLLLAGSLCLMPEQAPCEESSTTSSSSFFGTRKSKPSSASEDQKGLNFGLGKFFSKKGEYKAASGEKIVRKTAPEPKLYLLTRIPQAPDRPGLPLRPKEPPKIPRDPKP